MPVILYAEFTAKPGSESEVQMLISDLAERCGKSLVTLSSPSIVNATTRVSSLSSSSTSMRPVSKRISLPSTESSSTSSSAASSKRVRPS